ncbi:hypothetical protein BDR03DRAFT_1015841 [Suillus americanus]|nr:hypothetical protein BDR03DRAFT_1015841 [Suillus americanus]
MAGFDPEMKRRALGSCSKLEGHEMVTKQEIVVQAVKVMYILQKDYPGEDHVLVFGNAMMHLKHADDALAAQKMLKNPSQLFGPSASVKDANGKAVLGPDGKQVKEKIE